MTRTVARLRRQLEARGLTRRPVCPCCQREADARSFTTRGICAACEVALAQAERAVLEARLADLDERIGALWPALRECEAGDQAAMIERELTTLEQERLETYYALHPDEVSHA